MEALTMDDRLLLLVLALLGWGVAVIAGASALSFHAMLKKAWAREDWYRDQLLKP